MSFEILDDDSIGDEAPLFDVNDCKTLLNILLVNPGQFELQEKSSGVRKDFFCTLN